MVGAGRVLTHPPGYSGTSRGRWPMARLIPAALDIASLFTGMVLFHHLMEPTYDRNCINTIFGHIQYNLYQR
jgi:hypothetical protein